MARHGENIYKRKDGRYEGRYVIGKTLSGKTRFGYVYGHTSVYRGEKGAPTEESGTGAKADFD